MSAVNRLRLATYNVERMVDGVPNSDSRRALREKKKSEESFSAVAEILQASHSDIVSLQEVENLEMLSALREHGDLKQRFPYSLLVEGNDETKGFDVALLSRYPIQSFTTHKDHVIGEDRGEKQHFSRDLLQVEVSLPQKQTLRVFCAHFVAQGGVWCDRKRLREAEAAANIVEHVSRNNPTEFTVFLGDLNDWDDSPVLNTLEDADLSNSSTNFKPSWGASKPHPLYPPSRIDHILAGACLAENLTNSGVFEHPKNAVASDHQLVYADYTLVA